jgi:hypothetical protein
MSKQTRDGKIKTGMKAKPPEAPAVEILDIDVPDYPAWESPESIRLLAASDEPREWALASAVVRYEHLMTGHLVQARAAKDLKLARDEFEPAVALSRVLQRAFRNLHDYRHKGVQRIVKEYSDGPTIGQSEKISKMTRRDGRTAEGRTLERIQWIAENYRTLGQRFTDHADTATPSVLPLQSPNARQSDDVGWHRLSAAAFQESTRFDALYTRLERAGVQIIMVESRRHETTTKGQAGKPKGKASGGKKV